MVFWFMIVDLYEFLFQECKNVFFDTDTEQFLSFVTFAGVQQTSAIFFYSIPAVYSEPGELKRGRLE